eukprot:TRINITY_DN50599_c0_g1_i1.p1 TRINITY_DN50599_c0_g1~~TRINITY_DN50599_c0_g1_i1.p1  ORF type:complete len:741 (+),score=237.39 TRINITY_DN50599_c0_g1_i1:68-2290(+)
MSAMHSPQPGQPGLSRASARGSARALRDEGRRPSAGGEEEELISVAVRLRPPPSTCDGVDPSRLCQEGSMLWKGARMKWQWDDTTVTNATGDSQGQQFVYSHVFGPATPTEALYRALARPTVTRSLGGFCGCIFAFGQTNSGKTYTIVGTPESPGIIPLACVDAFNFIRNCTDEVAMLLRISYLEIYNENIKDLLCDDGNGLQLCEDDCGNFVVQGVTEEIVSCLDDVLRLIAQGNRRRAEGTNNVHEHASRSHAVFQLVLERRDFASQTVRVGRLNIVDLAGSESNYNSFQATPTDVLERRKDQQTIAARVAAQSPGALAAKERAAVKTREGSNIRKSLNALVRVVQVLAAGRDQFVPYRDSKLTRLLRSALGGNSHTCCICTINPEEEKETVATLRFALQAQQIHNRPRVVAVATDKAMIGRLESNLRTLRRDIFLQKEAKEEELRALQRQHGMEESQLRGTLGQREEELARMQRKLQGMQKFLLTSQGLADASTTLAGHYQVPEGHGGGMTVEMIHRERQARAARDSGKTAPLLQMRRRHSFPEALYRDEASKSLFDTASGLQHSKGDEVLLTAAEMLRLSNSEAVGKLHASAAQETCARQRTTIGDLRRQVARLEEELRSAEQRERESGAAADELRRALREAHEAADAAEQRLGEARRRSDELEASGAPYGEAAAELEQKLAAAQRRAEEADAAAAASRSAAERSAAQLAAKEGELAEARKAAEAAKQQKGCCVVQ